METSLQREPTPRNLAPMAIGSRRHASGFTLLEFVLVLLIMGTVLGMAAPSLRGFFASRRTADATAQIATMARLAGVRARAEGRTFHLHLDAKAGTYTLTAGGQALADESGRTFHLPDGTRMDWTGSIAFFPDGRKDVVRIRLTGMQGEEAEVSCPSALEPYR